MDVVKFWNQSKILKPSEKNGNQSWKRAVTPRPLSPRHATAHATKNGMKY